MDILCPYLTLTGTISVDVSGTIDADVNRFYLEADVTTTTFQIRTINVKSLTNPTDPKTTPVDIEVKVNRKEISPDKSFYELDYIGVTTPSSTFAYSETIGDVSEKAGVASIPVSNIRVLYGTDTVNALSTA